MYKPLIVSLLLLTLPAWAQVKIIGQILDAGTDKPLPYASVKASQNGKIVGGNIANEQGNFSFAAPAGQTQIEVEFIGYKSLKTEATISGKTHNLGVLKLKISSQNLEEVQIRAEKSTLELSLDKRVFNVGKDLANAGGNATEILMNVPSVSVEADGGIKLRGSDNVRILIDGKPSGLVSFKGGGGLQNLPANLIDKIEVITNPSARYEAEGMAGIINIILKKNQANGLNGSVDIVSGLPLNEGIGLNLNYRKNKVNFFVNYGLTYRSQPNIAHTEQSVFEEENTLLSVQDRAGKLFSFNNNIRGGFDYFVTEKSTLTGSYLFKRSDAHRITDFVYLDYLNQAPIRTTNRQQDETEDEPNSEYALVYKKDFGHKNHQFTAEARFLDNWEHSDQKFYQDAQLNSGQKDPINTFLQTSINDEYEKQYLLQADYSRPFSKDGKIETGLRTTFRNMVNDYYVAQGQNASDQVVIPGFANYFIYDEDIAAAYGILSNKSGKISWQTGLRAENTSVKTTLKETGEVNPRRYANLFPSAHLSYQFNKENAMQLSGGRRIRRPFYNDLSPFATFADSRNFVSGNPNLDPEYTWAYEAGHIYYLAKGTFSSNLFYRDTQDKIQSIRTVDNQGFASTFPRNLNGEKSYGTEFFFQHNTTKWYRTDATLSFFRAEIDGQNIEPTYLRTTYSWFARHTSRFSFAKKLDLQLRASYEAPQKTLQGTRKALYYFDLSASKEVFKNKGNINLNVTDVLNSRIMRNVIEGPNFYTDSWAQFRRRQINLTLNYRINNGKKMKSLIEE